MNVAGLNVGISGDPAALINAINASTRAITKFTADVDKMNTRLNTSAFSITRLLAAIGVGISVREVVGYADAWTLAEGRIRLAAGATADLQKITRDLFRTAQDTRQSFDATADLYARVARNSRQLGLSQRDVVQVTRAVGQAMRISNTSVGQAQAAMIQLGQALSSGRLAGDELRSILENAPRLAEAIATSIGVTTGQLKKMGAEGVLTSQAVAQAILDASDQLEREAAQLPTTVGQSLVGLKNSVQRFIGETNNAIGATRGLVRAINFLGEQFDDNRAVVEALAFALGASGLAKAAFVAARALGALGAIQGIGAFLALIPAIKSVRDALALAAIAGQSFWRALMGPVGIAVTAITIAAGIFYKWRKGIDDAKKATDELRESFEKLEPAALQQKFSRAVDEMFALEKKIEDIQNAAGGIKFKGKPLNLTADQRAEIAGLQKQIEAVTKAAGIMGQVLTTMNAENRRNPVVTPQAEDALKKYADEVNRIVAVYKDMEQGGRFVSGVTEKLRDKFEETGNMLRGLKDPFSEEAVKLRQILQNLAELPEIKLRLRFDPKTNELRQLTQKQVDDIIRPLLDGETSIQFGALRDRLAKQIGNLPVKVEAIGLDVFERSIGRAVEAQNRLNDARKGTDKVQIIGAEKQYADAVDGVRASLADLGRAMEASGTKLDASGKKSVGMKKAIDDINAAVKSLLATLGGTFDVKVKVPEIDVPKIPPLTVVPIMDLSSATRSIDGASTDWQNRLRGVFTRSLGSIQFDQLRERMNEQMGKMRVRLPPVDVEAFNKDVQKAVEAQNRLNLARLGGNRDQIISAELQYKTALDAVRESLGSLARALDGAGVKGEDAKRAIDAINEATGKLDGQLIRVTSNLDKFLNFARGATGIGRAVLGVADAMRKVDDNIRRAIQSAVGLFDALVDLAQAQKDLNAGTGSPITVAASALGAAGAGLSLVNSVVTALRADQERLRDVIREQIEAQRRNTEVMERLRVPLEGFDGTVGDLTKVVGVIRFDSGVPGRPSMLEFVEMLAAGQQKADYVTAGSRANFDRLLKQAGISLPILLRASEDLGIELFDQAGRIIPGAFATLADAIDLQIQAAIRFAHTLDDQRRALELEANVFDREQTPQTQIDQGLALLQELAPDLARRFFAGIKPGDTAAVEQALRLLTTTLLRNVSLIQDEFGDLFGKDDLIAIIELVEQGLDGLADATNEATNAMLNVPQGFKIARARFEAMDADEGPGVLAPTTPGDRTGDPRFSDVTTEKEKEGADEAAGIVIEGDVIVHTTAKNAHDLFVDVARVVKAKKRAIGRSATTDDVIDQTPG